MKTRGGELKRLHNTTTSGKEPIEHNSYIFARFSLLPMEKGILAHAFED